METLSLPWWISFPATCFVFAILCVVMIALFRALMIVARAAINATKQAIELLTAKMVAAIFAGATIAGKLALGAGLLAAWPLAALWRVSGAKALDAVDLQLEAFRQKQELRRLWRDEFLDQFATFKEFVAAFEQGMTSRDHGRGPRPEPEREEQDAFAAACRVLGLPVNGQFGPKDLNSVYRLLMQKAHPDAGGTHARAAQLNAARDFIKKRKGWL